MAEINVRTNSYDQIETHIPVSDDIMKLADDLQDDFLSPKKHYELFKKMKVMISDQHNGIDVSDHDSWSVEKDNGINYIIFYKDGIPVPPSMLKTGHIYYNTYMEGAEGADNCGTCNGGKCDSCADVYRDKNGLLYNWPPKE